MESHSKTIYVLQMHTGTMPARVIRLMTRYEYSHVAIALEKDCKTTFSFGRRHLHRFWNGGFVVEQQNGPFFTRFRKTRCRIYEIQVTDRQYAFVRCLLANRMLYSQDYAYDYMGILLRYFRIPVTFPNRAVCSQFVAEVLEEGRVTAFDKPACFVKPRDFENCGGFRTIYEGLYRDYRTA